MSMGCNRVLLVQQLQLSFYHLLHGTKFSTAGVDFVKVVLDLLQVRDTIATTQFQDKLEQRNRRKTCIPREHEIK